jgi:ATP-dependent DNA helicase RecQ
VLRQLIALGHVHAEGEFGTLALTDSARQVLRGEVPVTLRVAADRKPRVKAARVRGMAGAGPGKPPPVPLDEAATARFAALRAWRAEVAREHNLPAYVVFHDVTLAEMSRECPATLDALAAIGGVGSKKLQAYGAEILRLLGAR